MKTALIVLAACGCLVAPSISAAKASPAPMAAQAKLQCSGHGDADSMTLQDAEATPFYALLQSKVGDPTSCALSRSDDNEVFALNFAKGVTFTFTDNAILELSQSEVVLPAGSTTISRDEAVKTLKTTEKDDAPKGMGVHWARLMAPIPAGDADVVAEGKTCNAKAHVKYSGGAVVGFGFSAAC